MNTIYVKLLNGDLLQIEFNPIHDNIHTIHKLILDVKPKLLNYDLELFNISNDTDLNYKDLKIMNINDIKNNSIIGIYIRERPHIDIIYDGLVDYYKVDRSAFNGYYYKNTIQQYIVILYISEEYTKF